MTTVTSAVEDVEGLHNKIDRKTNVETSNKESTRLFEKVGSVNILFIITCNDRLILTMLRV